MKYLITIVILLILAAGAFALMTGRVSLTPAQSTSPIDSATDQDEPEPVNKPSDQELSKDEQAAIDAKADVIRVTSPEPLAIVNSPLTVVGEARGTWYFEASFPVVLVDWDGRIIAEGHAEAQADWMTEDFVPFRATLEFSAPASTTDPDFMHRGILILKKDNPSGLPENDDALEIPVRL